MDFFHHAFDVLPSTNDEAIVRARAGASAGTLITATQQSAGRGRQGRNWVSAPGNVYASLLVRPRRDVPEYGQLAFVSALALGETIGSYGIRWQLKWPNDVQVDGAKISGLLLESEPGWVVIGMGVNIAHAPEVTGRSTTSLQAQGVTSCTAISFIERLLPNMSRWLEVWENQGFMPIRSAWLEHAYGVGQPIKVALASARTAEGVFDGIDKDGALLLGQPGTAQQRILAGDVFFA